MQSKWSRLLSAEQDRKGAWSRQSFLTLIDAKSTFANISIGLDELVSFEDAEQELFLLEREEAPEGGEKSCDQLWNFPWQKKSSSPIFAFFEAILHAIFLLFLHQPFEQTADEI